MIEKVYSLTEAQEWFLSHSEGEIECVANNGQRKACDTFKKVREFYEQNAG